MTKICLNEIGVKKQVFRKNKVQLIKWEDISDVQVLTRSNGYSYIIIIIISDKPIKSKCLEEVLKEKNIIYFTFNKKAIDFINNKIYK